MLKGHVGVLRAMERQAHFAAPLLLQDQYGVGTVLRGCRSGARGVPGWVRGLAGVRGGWCVLSPVAWERRGGGNKGGAMVWDRDAGTAAGGAVPRACRACVRASSCWCSYVCVCAQCCVHPCVHGAGWHRARGLKRPVLVFGGDRVCEEGATWCPYVARRIRIRAVRGRPPLCKDVPPSAVQLAYPASGGPDSHGLPRCAIACVPCCVLCCAGVPVAVGRHHAILRRGPHRARAPAASVGVPQCPGIQP